MQHPSSINSNNCLKLGSSPIGSKTTSFGSEVFDNVTLKLKNTKEAKFLLEETEKYLKKEYKWIYDGSMQGLETCPPKYDYGVETKKGHIARAMQFADEKLIEKRIQHLEQKQTQTMEDEREKSHLELILKQKIPLSTEDKVIMRLQNFFQNYRGLLLHSYKPEAYTQRYIELAKDLRQHNNDPQKYDPPNLTTLEKDILDLLNISSNSIDQWVSSSVNKIQKKQAAIKVPFPEMILKKP